MATTRECTFLSTRDDLHRKFDTSVTTYGELKPQLQQAGLDLTDLKAMLKEGRTTLEDDGAILPEGNFTLIFTASKMKSGK